MSLREESEFFRKNFLLYPAICNKRVRSALAVGLIPCSWHMNAGYRGEGGALSSRFRSEMREMERPILARERVFSVSMAP
jgi:hypothetical protein